ncbi:MAG: c-type cytochrome, partial [Rubripirellula sp.]
QTAVVVHQTVEDLEAWIEKVSKRPGNQSLEAWGEKLYNQRGCAGCHSLDGTKRVGPSFKESYGNERVFADDTKVTADEDYIRNSILYPKKQVVKGYQPVMPSYKGQLSDDDIASIIEYLKSVSDYGPKAAAEPAEEEKSTEEQNTEE